MKLSAQELTEVLISDAVLNEVVDVIELETGFYESIDKAETFESAGYLTNDDGFVLVIGRSKFEITVQKVK